MESKYDIYKFFDEEHARLKGNPDHKSEKIREYIKEFGKLNDLDEIIEVAMFQQFIDKYPEIEITKNYFHTIASKSWHIRIDEYKNKWIQLSRPKPQKRSIGIKIEMN